MLSAKAKLLLCKSKIITEGWQPEPSCRAALHVWEKPACFPCWHFILLTNVGAFGRMEPSARLRCRIPRRGGSVGRGPQRSWVRQCWLQGSPPHCRVVMGPFFPLKQLHSHLSLPPVGVTGVFSSCQHGKVARVELPLKPAGWAPLWVTPPAKPSEPQNHPNRPKTCRKNPRMLKNTGRELRGVSQPRYSQSVYCWSWANSAGLSEIQPPSLIVGHSGAAPRPPTTTPGAAQAHISTVVGSGPVAAGPRASEQLLLERRPSCSLLPGVVKKERPVSVVPSPQLSYFLLAPALPAGGETAIVTVIGAGELGNRGYGCFPT